MRINEAIYAYIDSMRAAKGLTLDQIATEARRYGATWTPGFISGMKRNASAASLFNMLILVKSLESLTGESLVLSDLFPGEGDIKLDGGASISREELRKALNGKSFRIIGRTAEENVRRSSNTTNQSIIVEFDSEYHGKGLRIFSVNRA